MDRLKLLHHSISECNSRGDTSFIYVWTFYNYNNVLQNLEYKHSTIYANMYDENTFTRGNVQHITEKYTLSYQKESTHEQIRDINEWVVHNYKYLKESHDNYMQSNDIIKYIKGELGDYNYALTYEIGWSVKDIYKLCIDLYSNKIVLNYKGKNINLSDKKVKTFIQKNRELMMQAKEIDYKKYIKQCDEIKQKKYLEQLGKANIVGEVLPRNKYESFIIKRTLKERYEGQACKPLPFKYPWEH